MNTLLEQGVFGIVTGILTTAILFIIKTVWTSQIVPMWVSARYQGVLIDGQWAGAARNDDPSKGEEFESNASLFITQKAHNLAGTFIFHYKTKHRNFSLEFAVNGYMWEGYVTLNFTPKDRRVTSYGTTLLKLHDGGSMLTGIWLFRHVLEEYVNQSPLTLFRNQQNS